MKKIILLFAVVITFAACKTTKNVERTITSTATDSSHVAQKTAHSDRIMVDTTKTESGSVVITEIEFGDPVIEPGNDTTPAIGWHATTADIVGIGKLSGVKKIRQTAIQAQKTESGRSEKDSADVQETQNDAVTHWDNKTTEWKEIKKTVFPLKYLLITFAAMVAVGLLIWKRKKVATWFSKFLSILWRIG